MTEKDFRKGNGIWDIENARFPRNFSVSRLMPQIRRLLHSRNYFGPFSLKAVVSDANDLAKIDPDIYRDLRHDREINVTNCGIPNRKQVADDLIKMMAIAWVDREDSRILVLIGGDGDMLISLT